MGLSEDSTQQYSSVKLFLADLRKMFRNCFTFNQKDTEIYKHAKRMEEKLDQLLEIWVPEFAGDPLINVGTKRPASPKPGPSAKKKKKDSDFESSDSEDMSEGERERQQYLAVVQQSIEDQDPSDVDFVPDGMGKGKGKGKRRK